jgi:hypothetical protein
MITRPNGWQDPSVTAQVDEEHIDAECLAKIRRLFPTNLDIVRYISAISDGVLNKLYERYPDTMPKKTALDVYIRPFDGLAYVTGDTRKEMHISSGWINEAQELSVDYLNGVVWHEMVQ